MGPGKLWRAWAGSWARCGALPGYQRGGLGGCCCSGSGSAAGHGGRGRGGSAAGLRCPDRTLPAAGRGSWPDGGKLRAAGPWYCTRGPLYFWGVLGGGLFLRPDAGIFLAFLRARGIGARGPKLFRPGGRGLWFPRPALGARAWVAARGGARESARAFRYAIARGSCHSVSFRGSAAGVWACFDYTIPGCCFNRSGVFCSKVNYYFKLKKILSFSVSIPASAAAAASVLGPLRGSEGGPDPGCQPGDLRQLRPWVKEEYTSSI